MQEPPGTSPTPAWAASQLVVIAAAVAAGLHVLSLWGAVPVDDDYIVYRYARNWVEHGVYGFNLEGGATDGVTTPLWFLIVSLGVALGVAPEVWSPVWGGAAMVLTVLLLGRSGRRLLPSAWAWAPAVLFAISPAAAWHARAGLGTLPMTLAAAFALDRFVSFRTGRGESRAWPMGAAFAVVVLFRLEGALLVVAAGWALRRSMATFWPAWVLPALAVTSVCVWRWTTFGHWLPASGTLKGLPLFHELQYGGRYLVRSMGEGGLALWLVAGALSWATAPRFRGREDAPVAAFVGCSCALALAFVLCVGGDWMVYGRLMLPFFPLALMGACLGLARWRGAAALRWASGAALALATCWGFAARPQAAFENRFFEQWWLDVGSVLGEKAAPGSKVALAPIGAIGWTSELPIVDILGLTHGAFLGLPPDLEGVGVKGHHRHSADWVFGERPDYIILGNGILQPGSGQVSVNPWEADIVTDRRFQVTYVQDRLDVQRPGGVSGVLPYLRLRTAARLR